MYEVLFYCDNLVFPEAGEYWVELIVAEGSWRTADCSSFSQSD